MVFHTAPPQPASKARMICSPQLVGGPEASQKGFGEWMPAKLVRRSAMLHLGWIHTSGGRPPPVPGNAGDLVAGSFAGASCNAGLTPRRQSRANVRRRSNSRKAD